MALLAKIEIDITIMDALKRPFQCATIQLDFNLPVQFKLTYRTGESATADKPEAADGQKDLDGDRKRPVMIHRAILGSLERFIAIITEHFGGKWYVAFQLLHFVPTQLMVSFHVGRFGFHQDKLLSCPLPLRTKSTHKK
jgi:threonyl-tRNA synthetase